MRVGFSSDSFSCFACFKRDGDFGYVGLGGANYVGKVRS